MTHLVHIGNSFGVRIPKAIINQVGFNQETELSFKVTQEGLLIAPIRQKREGWEEAFKGAEKSKEHLLLSDEIMNEFDQGEWEW